MSERLNEPTNERYDITIGILPSTSRAATATARVIHTQIHFHSIDVELFTTLTQINSNFHSN